MSKTTYLSAEKNSQMFGSGCSKQLTIFSMAVHGATEMTDEGRMGMK